MMRVVLVFFVFVCFAFAKTDICVSIPPQAFFVKKIAKDTVNLHILIPPGSSPATYAPKPSKLKEINKCSIYFTIKVPFEKNWLKRFLSINPSLKVVDTTKYIDKIPLSDSLGHKKHDHDHGMPDPHVWLDPKLVLKMAKIIQTTLSKNDPKNREFYAKNFKNFKIELAKLQIKLKKDLTKLKNREFIVFHPSFGYFAKAFNLKQIAIEKGGKEPSLKQIKKIIDFIKAKNIKTIFFEPQFSQKSVRYIAKKTGAQIVGVDPLSYEWDQNLLRIAKSLEKAD